MTTHQFVERGRVAACDETLIADRVIGFLYNTSREQPSFLQRVIASAWVTDALATWEFDRPLRHARVAVPMVAHRLMIRESESLRSFASMRTLRELFERQIRYWDTRPMIAEPERIVSPADGRLLPFCATRTDSLPIKQKFVGVEALLGSAMAAVDPMTTLSGVIVRLTPDVYHYTHTPVAGRVIHLATIEGEFHSCNPTALINLPGSYAINRRVVTVYDTDVPHGSRVGRVAQVDVAAMMIGRIESRFSVDRYESPRALCVGDFVPRGVPVSLFRPGSSTSIVLWNSERVALARELLLNSSRADLSSRFSHWLGRPWVETQVAVRQTISELAQETRV